MLYRSIIFMIVFSLIIYYIAVVLSMFDVIKFYNTNEHDDFNIKSFIPFYLIFKKK